MLLAVNENQTTAKQAEKYCIILNDIVKYGKSKTLKHPYFFLTKKRLLIELTNNFKTLKHLNFGDYFILWIEMILKNITSCVR